MLKVMIDTSAVNPKNGLLPMIYRAIMTSLGKRSVKHWVFLPCSDTPKFQANAKGAKSIMRVITILLNLFMNQQYQFEFLSFTFQEFQAILRNDPPAQVCLKIEWELMKSINSLFKVIFQSPIPKVFKAMSSKSSYSELLEQVQIQKVQLKSVISQLAGFKFNPFNASSQQVNQNEGFSESEESDESEKASEPQKFSSGRRKTTVLMGLNSMSSGLQKQLEEKNQVIEQLKQRVEQKEQQMNSLMVGYKKDLQHFKSMQARKEQDQFEVSYFDAVSTLEPAAREILEEKMREMKAIHEKRLKQQQAKAKEQEKELVQLRERLQAFMDQSSATSLFQVMMRMERNPYKLWKVIQDQLGLKTIFQVLEVQNHTVGINYREFDAFIQKSQASRRIYDEYKKSLEQQMISLIERTSHYLNTLTTESAEKTSKIQQLQEKMASLRTQLIDELQDKFLHTVRVKQFQEVRDLLSQDPDAKWDLCAKWMSRACLLIWRQKPPRYAFKSPKCQCAEFQVQAIRKEVEYQQLNDRISALEFQSFQQQKFIDDMKKKKLQVEQKNHLLEECLQKCVMRIEDSQKDKVLKDFQHRLDEIYVHKGEYIDQVIMQHRKAQQTFIRMFDHWEYNHSLTQTDLGNLRYSLTYLESKTMLEEEIKNINEMQTQIHKAKLHKDLIDATSQTFDQEPIFQTSDSQVNQTDNQQNEQKKYQSKTLINQRKQLRYENTLEKGLSKKQSCESDQFGLQMHDDETQVNHSGTQSKKRGQSQMQVRKGVKGSTQQDQKWRIGTAQNYNEKSLSLLEDSPQSKSKWHSSKLNQLTFQKQIEKALKSVPNQIQRYEFLQSLPKKLNLSLSDENERYLQEVERSKQSNNRKKTKMSMHLDETDFVSPTQLYPKSRAHYFYGSTFKHDH